MFLPISTDRPRRRPTVATYWLLAANCAVFLAGAILERSGRGEWLVETFALFGENRFRAWQLLTYQFLHGGFGHLLGNMLFLYVFGPNVEDRFGRWLFLAFYLVGGAAAAGTHIVFTAPEPVFDPAVGAVVAWHTPVIGASGSISAVTGAFLVLFPLTHVRMLIIFFFIGVWAVPAWWLIALAIAKDLLFQGLGASEGIAHLAHLGGYAFGSGLALTLLWTKLLAREPYDLFSIGRQAHRRRQFRELTTKGLVPWRDRVSPKDRVVRRREPDAAETRLAERRAEVSRLISSGDVEGAARAYASLVDEFGNATMSRRDQLDIANHFYTTGQASSARVAYDLFLKKFPRDPECPRVRLLVAALCARYLNDPVRAKALLAELDSAPMDEPERVLAAELAAELG